MSEPQPTPTPEPEPTPPEPEEEARYTVTSWAGHPNYECTKCDFATVAETEALGAEAMDDHWRMFHPAPPEYMTPPPAEEAA